MPKLTRTAGFEWGTGFYINPTSPEEAAQVLRNAKLSGRRLNVSRSRVVRYVFERAGITQW